MRVLQIVCHMYPHIGGIEQVARDISGAVCGVGIEQKIICFNENAQDKSRICKRKETVQDTVDGVDVIRCGSFAKMFSQCLSLTYPSELKKVMDGFKPDCVIFHYPNPYLAAFFSRYMKRDFKLIVFYHLDITRQKVLEKLFRGQTLRLLERADKIIATSPNYIDGSPYLSRFREKVSVVPCCVRAEKFELTPRLADKVTRIRESCKGKTICFAVGRHVPYKGLMYLIKASKYLDDSFQIFIGGKGPLTESLKEEARTDRKITFLGRLSDEDLAAYCHACDIFCFPSITKNEAFGIALAEGMYCGKPAVTFTIPGSGVNYVNLNGVTGIECPNGDSEAYAGALKKLAGDEESRKRYGDAAKKRVEENFTIKIFEKNITHLLNSICI